MLEISGISDGSGKALLDCRTQGPFSLYLRDSLPPIIGKESHGLALLAKAFG